MVGQISIYEWLKPNQEDLNTLPEEDMIQQIANATGLEFHRIDFENVYADYSHEYEARKHKVRYTANYDNYMIGDHARFIAVGCNAFPAGYKEGSGAPCDSIDEAITWIKKRMEKYATGRK